MPDDATKPQSGPEPDQSTTEAFEEALARNEAPHFVLRLFVSGTTPRSQLAIANLRKVCEENLAGRYELEVIDVYQQPERASADQIVAVPTLVKELPKPIRRFIGDLSDKEKILIGLELRPKET